MVWYISSVGHCCMVWYVSSVGHCCIAWYISSVGHCCMVWYVSSVGNIILVGRTEKNSTFYWTPSKVEILFVKRIKFCAFLLAWPLDTIPFILSSAVTLNLTHPLFSCTFCGKLHGGKHFPVDPRPTQSNLPPPPCLIIISIYHSGLCDIVIPRSKNAAAFAKFQQQQQCRW